MWNSPIYRNHPFAPHNRAIDRDSPFKPWNSPFGREADLTAEERRDYGLPPLEPRKR
ncbi:MAG: hypothetical protein N2652_09440 [Kiritimatiellae bacterium]|nr:hypothetical protein [Kiritimatiellia bacterium]